MTMSPSQFEDQVIGIVVTLCKLYEAQGTPPAEARQVVSKFLTQVADSLVTIEPEEQEEQPNE